MPLAWYFAYGSNMQTETLRGRRGIEFHCALPGRAPGWRLVLDKPALVSFGGSFANIVPDAGGEVFGVLYEVGADALEVIDLTEGVLIGNYERVEIAVWPLADSSAEPVRASTLTSPRRDPTLQPSTRYMELLIAGAIEHGLPAAYVDFLRQVPARAESAAAAAMRPFLDGALRLLSRRR